MWGQGFESHTSLKKACKNPGFLFATAKVASITAMVFFTFDSSSLSSNIYSYIYCFVSIQLCMFPFHAHQINLKIKKEFLFSGIYFGFKFWKILCNIIYLNVYLWLMISPHLQTLWASNLVSRKKPQQVARLLQISLKVQLLLTAMKVNTVKTKRMIRRKPHRVHQNRVLRKVCPTDYVNGWQYHSAIHLMMTESEKALLSPPGGGGGAYLISGLAGL